MLYRLTEFTVCLSEPIFHFSISTASGLFGGFGGKKNPDKGLEPSGIMKSKGEHVTCMKNTEKASSNISQVSLGILLGTKEQDDRQNGEA